MNSVNETVEFDILDLEVDTDDSNRVNLYRNKVLIKSGIRYTDEKGVMRTRWDRFYE